VKNQSDEVSWAAIEDVQTVKWQSGLAKLLKVSVELLMQCNLNLSTCTRAWILKIYWIAKYLTMRQLWTSEIRIFYIRIFYIIFSINLLVVYRESVSLIGYITRRLSADSLQLWIASGNRLFWTRNACFTPQCTSRAVFETFELPM